ncbi:MAG TPA: exodeoxyribonuclease VII large subunit [Clostridiales bacterium]|nr:exodeoxyribonuclease VII large subunit [Clostridiales bacterium]
MGGFALTVTQLNRYVRSLLEGDGNLVSVFVTGEISNFKNHYQSGHLYFSLKDDASLVKCVMFRQDAARLKFKPQDGMKVICRGRVSLYERDGQYQYYVEDMQPDGAGSLALAFEQLKLKLQKEGLFDEKLKRPLPELPQRIAVVTSDTGAAVRDIISILNRRYPLCEVVLCPVQVQGAGAAESMIGALERLNGIDNIDIIIIGRGGGSAEDLWAFNDENLARAIRRTKAPVISAVGHETDYTICDFVADLRAPTPSAAAELAVPDIARVKDRVNIAYLSILNHVTNKVEALYKRLNDLSQRRVLKNPEYIFDQYILKCDYLSERLNKAFVQIIYENNARFVRLSAALDALSPLKVLSRGYSVVYKDDRIAGSVKELSEKDIVDIRFLDGKANCTVNYIKAEAWVKEEQYEKE